MPYSPMHKHCIQMKDHKGKTTGLMMEGSAMHMSMLHKETVGQERKNLIDDDPLKMEHDSAMEMSPYKMHNKEHLQKVGKDMPVHMDHEGDHQRTFTGMSGGSALHQEKKPEKKKDLELPLQKTKILK